MNKKAKKCLIATAVLLVAFVVFTVLVKTYDVQAIGPNGSEVGFGALNTKMRDIFGESPVWEKYTECLGYLSIGIGFFFALIGLIQLIKGKSLKAVDADIYCLGGFYVMLAAVYVLFEKVVINYRPILEDGELAASYPSSHTVLIVGIMITTALQLANRLEKKSVRILGCVFSVVLAAAAVLGRLLAGVHWFTDIIGALLLVGALIMAYCTAVKQTE